MTSQIRSRPISSDFELFSDIEINKAFVLYSQQFWLDVKRNENAEQGEIAITATRWSCASYTRAHRVLLKRIIRSFDASLKKDINFYISLWGCRWPRHRLHNFLLDNPFSNIFEYRMWRRICDLLFSKRYYARTHALIFMRLLFLVRE